MNVDLIPGYYWDILTPTDGKPGPIYLAIVETGDMAPDPNLMIPLPADSTDHYKDVMSAMKQMNESAPELFDHNAQQIRKFRNSLDQIFRIYTNKD